MGNRIKKMMTTTHDEQVLTEFKIACVRNGKRYNEVIDQMMNEYIEKTNRKEEEKDGSNRKNH